MRSRHNFVGARKRGRSCVGEVSVWTCVCKLYSCQRTPYSLHFLSYNEAALRAEALISELPNEESKMRVNCEQRDALETHELLTGEATGPSMICAHTSVAFWHSLTPLQAVYPFFFVQLSPLLIFVSQYVCPSFPLLAIKSTPHPFFVSQKVRLSSRN